MPKSMPIALVVIVCRLKRVFFLLALGKTGGKGNVGQETPIHRTKKHPTKQFGYFSFSNSTLQAQDRLLNTLYCHNSDLFRCVTSRCLVP